MIVVLYCIFFSILVFLWNHTTQHLTKRIRKCKYKALTSFEFEFCNARLLSSRSLYKSLIVRKLWCASSNSITMYFSYLNSSKHCCFGLYFVLYIGRLKVEETGSISKANCAKTNRKWKQEKCKSTFSIVVNKFVNRGRRRGKKTQTRTEKEGNKTRVKLNVAAVATCNCSYDVPKIKIWHVI